MNAKYTGNQIAERRKALGLTQKQLAEKLHITDKAVSKWERGINFPDLGLMENLAATLDTSPAILLGLEDANRDEIVKNMVQVHGEQLGDAEKCLRRLGWAALAASVLLWMGFLQDALYVLLGWLLPVMILGGLCLLFRYGAIKEWDGPDMLIFLGCLFPFGLVNLGYLMTDHGFSDWLNIPCYLLTCGMLQWLFYCTMAETWAKALPVLGLAAYQLWHLYAGSIDTVTAGCLGICFASWLLLRKLDKHPSPIPVGRLLAATLAGLVIFCFLFQDSLVKAYVGKYNDRLTAYCEAVLTDPASVDTHRYGPWDVSVNREEKMVEFHTGGSGIGSETSYKGFYYSPEDAYLPFQGCGEDVEVYDGTGYWTDGTDNYGTVHRLCKYFFWFEAHF